MFSEKLPRGFNRSGLFDGSNLCELIWQGDMGVGLVTGSGVFGNEGVNPCVLSPALPSGGTSNMLAGGGQPVRAFKLGTIVRGDYGTEWMYCRWVPGSTTDLLPGLVFQIDENYTAALVSTTTAAVLTRPMGVTAVFKPAVAAGTYFLWLAVRGNVGVYAAASSLISGIAETTSTAGTVKFLITHTSGSYTISGLNAYAASNGITFTGNTVSGSPTIVNVASQISLEGAVGGLTDLLLGQTITGTDLPSNACIAAIRKTGSTFSIDIGTSTTGAQLTLQNATGTATATTFTVTTLVPAVALNPTGASVVT